MNTPERIYTPTETIPTRIFDHLTNETPINPGLWTITGVDMTESSPPETADFSHGLITVEYPLLGTCILLNKDGGDAYGSYFNLIGGAAEPNESPQQTFIREMLEETGVQPDASRLRYIGLIETINAPSTPLYGYTMEKNELQSRQTITGSIELALVPVALLKKSVPAFPWATIGL